MEIRNPEGVGVHITALICDERWEAEYLKQKSGLHSKKQSGVQRHCPQCGKFKDSACFVSHRNIADVPPRFPICNVCRVG
jgi:hypothetical protein